MLNYTFSSDSMLSTSSCCENGYRSAIKWTLYKGIASGSMSKKYLSPYVLCASNALQRQISIPVQPSVTGLQL